MDQIHEFRDKECLAEALKEAGSNTQRVKQIYSEKVILKTVTQSGNYVIESRQINEDGSIKLRLVETNPHIPSKQKQFHAEGDIR